MEIIGLHECGMDHQGLVEIVAEHISAVDWRYRGPWPFWIRPEILIYLLGGQVLKYPIGYGEDVVSIVRKLNYVRRKKLGETESI